MQWMDKQSIILKREDNLDKLVDDFILQYRISCAYTPTRVLIEVKKVITSFLWDNRPSKIAYHLVIQDISAGGLKLVDLETRMQVAHMSIIRKTLP